MTRTFIVSYARTPIAKLSGSLASLPPRKGPPVLVETDEGIRRGTTADSLGRLKPAFSAQGTVTAGNASQLSDGGAAVVLVSEGQAARLLAPGGGKPNRRGGGLGVVALCGGGGQGDAALLRVA